jgi:putative cell wall-binding protein
MKKFLSILIIVVLCITILPSTVFAATKKYVIKTDVEYDLIKGEKITLSVDTSKSIKWSSSDKSIVTVSKKGVVTGKKSGTVTITAKYGKKKTECIVKVWDTEEDIVYENDISSDTSGSDRYSLSDEDIIIPDDEDETDLDGLY